MIFSKHNQNPKGWKTGDCVVRAISYATGKTWQEVFQDLCRNGNSFTLKIADGRYRVYSQSGEFLALSQVESDVMSTIKSFFEV